MTAPVNLNRTEHAYALAIEHGNYRAAARQAIRGIRYYGNSALADIWRIRLRGCLRRRGKA